jgi:hypothetical protein
VAGVEDFLKVVRAQIGDPYKWGAEGPDAFDCSGLVRWSLSQVGIKAPRTARAQWPWTRHVTEAQLQPGDLIFESHDGGPTPTHVVIYAGNGQILEAPRTGLDVRQRSWKDTEAHIVGYGRIPGITGAKAGSGGLLGNAFTLALPDSATAGLENATRALQALMWIFNPENWVRITSGAFGVILAGFALLFLMKAA